MGMNYYVAGNFCECCQRYDKDYHIGKSSWGWSFTFRGYEHAGYTSWKEWKSFLADKIIVDEDGRPVPYDEFVRVIEGPKSPGYVRDDGVSNSSYYKHVIEKAWFRPNREWEDSEGYSFLGVEFD